MHRHVVSGFLPQMMWIGGILLLFLASQLFWLRQIRHVGRRLILHSGWRLALGSVAAAAYLLVMGYTFSRFFVRGGTSPTHLTLRSALLDAPFAWWLFGSVVGAAIAACLGGLERVGSLAVWTWRKLTPRQESPLPSPSRRQFLQNATAAISAIPFAAGAYGLLYERLEVEVTRQRINLPSLPRAFSGFRMAQLSDLHIGPFMSAAEIRRCADTVNRLKPDLAVLTGDFVTWDASTQGAVVDALSGIRAPFGVFGCLGNHEMWTKTEDSITQLFALQNVRILRQAHVAIETGGESWNLIGVDFQTHGHMGRHGEGLVRRYLEGVEDLVQPGTANILLSHNPNTFDRAAELGIDLSIAGHTHGGQVALEFVSPEISPSRLVTPYVAGLFWKPGGQLYVNRGIGTIGIPIRIGAPPEITVYELVREA